MKTKPKSNFRVEIDKVAITVAIPPEHHKEVLNNAENIFQTLRKHNRDTYNSRSSGYRLSFKLPLGTRYSLLLENADSHIYVQVAPADERKAFLRMELNGHPYSEEKYKLIQLWVNEFLKHVSLTDCLIKITRLDIACDVEPRLSGLAVDYTSSMSSGRFSGPNGDKKTQYFGDKKSGVQLCVYEICETLLKTRFEFRIRKSITLAELAESTDYFDVLTPLKIYDLTKLKEKKETSFTPWLIHYINDCGLKTALRKLPSKDRKQLIEMLKPYKITVFSKGKAMQAAAKRVNLLIAALSGDFSKTNLKDEKAIEQHFYREWTSIKRNIN